ncbi:MAG TPA: hypothetical protein VK425_05535 [Acidimicrobiales bacterium]|nr:hypothetical protein [Acidimicrobiales bacterium]
MKGLLGYLQPFEALDPGPPGSGGEVVPMVAHWSSSLFTPDAIAP